MIPPHLKSEAEAAAKKELDSISTVASFLRGVRWLFTRLLEMSEKSFDESEVQTARDKAFEEACNQPEFAVADKKINTLLVAGRRFGFREGASYQATLDQAALLKARDEIARLEKFERWQKNTAEAQASLRARYKQCNHPDDFLYQDEHAKASCWECDWFAERARADKHEAVLKIIDYANRSRGYPTGSEWREIMGHVSQALSGDE